MNTARLLVYQCVVQITRNGSLCTVCIKLIIYNSVRMGMIRCIAFNSLKKIINCYFLSPIAVEACCSQPVMSVGLRNVQLL